MDETIIAIYSADFDYGLALGEALSFQHSNFLVTVYEDEEGLNDCAPYDLLLFDMDRSESLAKLSGRGNAIQLVSSNSETLKDLEVPLFKLFKYANIRELVSDIIFFKSLLTGKAYTEIKKENFKMIAVCSCMGGAGKTSVAMGLGQALRRYRGKKVLYLSLEEIESTLQYMTKRKSGLSIGEYLYYLLKDNAEAPDQEGFLIWDRHGVKAFNPDKGKNRLKELGTDQLSKFFNVVAGQGRYDCIIVDLGEVFSEGPAWILKRCDKVISVIKEDMAEGERQGRFDTYLNFALGKRAENDLIKAYNMSRHAERPDESGKDRILIDYDPDSLKYEQGICDISIDQDFGIGIKALSKAVT